MAEVAGMYYICLIVVEVNMNTRYGFLSDTVSEWCIRKMRYNVTMWNIYTHLTAVNEPICESICETHTHKY